MLEKSFFILFFISIHTQAFHSVLRINLSTILVVFYTGLYFIKMFVDQNETAIITKSQLFIIILCFFIIISSIHAGLFGLGWVLLKIFLFIFIPFLFVNYIYKKKLLKFTLKWFVLFTIISSIIAILQEILFHYTGKLLIGFVDTKQLKFMMEYTSSGVLLRVPAFFGFHYPFVYYLLTSSIIVFNYFIYKKNKTMKERVGIITALVILNAATLLTFSHDAFLLLILFLVISVVLRWHSRSIYFIMGVLFLLFILFTSGFINDLYDGLLSGISLGESRIRIQLAKEGLEGLRNHPWIGVGFENSSIYTSNYYQWPPHNSFIQVADEIGLLGFLAYFALILYVFKRGLELNMIFKEVNEITGIIRSLLLSYMIYILIIQFHPHAFSNYLWILIGLNEGAMRSISKFQIKGAPVMMETRSHLR